MAFSHPILETPRSILRPFTQEDLPALFNLLQEREVNTFLPWFPLTSLEETEQFFRGRLINRPGEYHYALCPKEDNSPIGYLNVGSGEAHDFGYALQRPFWGQGLTAEAGAAIIQQLRRDNIPYITATHDKNNPASGAVMQKLGMCYCYSYQEQWQPKNIPVIFRMYQLNLDNQQSRIYQAYWNSAEVRFIEDLL